MELIFATHNVHKFDEIRPELNPGIKLITLKDLNFLSDIPEISQTLEGNAIGKARFIYNQFKVNTIADDTGLEVEALHGRPGIFSARYAGDLKSSEENIRKLLYELHGKSNRKAQFRTIIALIINGEERLFEGLVEGEIVEGKKGDKGFGYDPVFRPFGFEKTFAEMDLKEKNKISHRARAIKKLIEFLNQLSLNTVKK